METLTNKDSEKIKIELYYIMVFVIEQSCETDHYVRFQTRVLSSMITYVVTEEITLSSSFQ